MAQPSSYGTCFGPTATLAGGSEFEKQFTQKIDFSSDNTAVGTDLELFHADHNMLIDDFYADVEKACSSAEATAQINIGVGSGGTNLVAGFTVLSLLTNTILDGGATNAGQKVGLTRGQKLVLGKVGANGAPTSGILHLHYKVKKRSDY